MAQGQILGIPRLRDATLRSVAPLGMTQPGMSRKTNRNFKSPHYQENKRREFSRPSLDALAVASR
jgi:hypothetical protein